MLNVDCFLCLKADRETMISITTDKAYKTLTIYDNGIGMTKVHIYCLNVYSFITKLFCCLKQISINLKFVCMYVCLIITVKRRDQSVPNFANRCTLAQKWFLWFYDFIYILLFLFEVAFDNMGLIFYFSSISVGWKTDKFQVKFKGFPLIKSNVCSKT